MYCLIFSKRYCVWLYIVVYVNIFLNAFFFAASRNEPEEEPTIQTLKYSIRNILQPDFGKHAVLKTKTQPRITFKPYEINKSPDSSKPFTSAPLGSLCQTVSQIGTTRISDPVVSGRKSPVKTPTTTTSATSSSTTTLPGVAEDGKVDETKVPTLWPAWVYCTRYSDRPSSGKKS